MTKKKDKIYRVTEDDITEIADVEFDETTPKEGVELDPFDETKGEEAKIEGAGSPVPITQPEPGEGVKIPLETAVRDVAELIDYLKREWPEFWERCLVENVSLTEILEGSRGDLKDPTIAKITAGFIRRRGQNSPGNRRQRRCQPSPPVHGI